MANARSHNAMVARRLVAKVKTAALRAIGKSTDALIPFLVVRVKEAVSVPGNPNTPAKRGAPPRRITGNLMRGVYGIKLTESKILIGSKAKSRKGFNYPFYHETRGVGRKSGLHPFVKPTVKRYQADIKRIARKNVQVGFGMGVVGRRR